MKDFKVGDTIHIRVIPAQNRIMNMGYIRKATIEEVFNKFVLLRVGKFYRTCAFKNDLVNGEPIAI